MSDEPEEISEDLREQTSFEAWLEASAELMPWQQRVIKHALEHDGPVVFRTEVLHPQDLNKAREQWRESGGGDGA